MVTWVVIFFLPAKWQQVVIPALVMTPHVAILLAIVLWPLWCQVRRWFRYPARRAPQQRIDTAPQASDRPRTLGRLLGLIVGTIGLICFVNTYSFLVAVWILGGDAEGGCIENGHYYLSPHLGCHVRIEVSHAVFQYMRWHLRSVLITGPIVGIYFVGFALKDILTRVARRWFPKAHG
jgi:hypothetical protein